MLRYFIIVFIFISVSNGNANNKEKIIEGLESTRNFDFKFEQNINKYFNIKKHLFYQHD